VYRRAPPFAASSPSKRGPMAKKKREAEAAAAEDEAPQEEEEAPKKQNKKKQKPAEPEEAVAEVAAVAATPNKRGGKRLKKAAAAEVAAEDAGEEGIAEEDKATKKAKRKAAAAAAVAEEDEEVEGAPGKKGKKAKRKDEGEEGAAEDAEDVETLAKGSQAKKAKVEKSEGDAPAEDASESRTVFVGGIPWTSGEDVLRRDFGECGEVVDVNLVINPETGLPKGIAFITFADVASAEKALKFDGDDYGGRMLKVARADTRQGKGAGKAQSKGNKSAGSELEVFVKNLSSHTDEESLREHFAPCGTMTEFSLPLRFGGKCKGFAFLVFEKKEGMEAAVALSGSELKNFKIVVEQAGLHKAGGDKGKGKGKGKDKGKGKGKDSGFEVFVNNLSFETTEEGLRKYFEECGKIERLHMPTKGQNKCMGFAWVTFREKASLDTAVDKNFDEFEGRRIRVEKSGEHKNQKPEDEKGES